MENQKEELEWFYEKYPEMIIHPITMEEPNQIITIYSGEFFIRNNGKSVSVNGDIYFDWFPSIRVLFKGYVVTSEISIMSLINATADYELIFNDLVFGKCQISAATLGKGSFVGGFMIYDAVQGDKTIPVSSARFVIPNLKDFHGGPIKKTKNDEIQFGMRRLVFENDDWKIIIDGLPNSSQLKDKLSEKGGYIIQYTGEITRSDKQISFNDLKSILSSFSCFLSFINGRRCGTLFHQGIHDDAIIWTDYTPHKTDMYKSVYSWSIWDDITQFNDLWQNFSKLWLNENDRDFIESAIHWYLEANKNAGYLEGSIIMIQVGLELLYNWFVVEKKKLMIGKDAENISASNKIRLLLSQIKLKTDLPVSLNSLNKFIADNDLEDGIEAFVIIRNALVHAQEEKRKKLLSIPQQVKIDALELGLWYLELCILHILNYKGAYQFRCSDKLWTGTNELPVPWTSLD